MASFLSFSVRLAVYDCKEARTLVLCGTDLDQYTVFCDMVGFPFFVILIILPRFELISLRDKVGFYSCNLSKVLNYKYTRYSRVSFLIVLPRIELINLRNMAGFPFLTSPRLINKFTRSCPFFIRNLTKV